MDQLLRKVYVTCESCDLIRPGETVLCGVSGGADSVAMLHLLRSLEEIQQQGWKVVIGHVNHQLRGKESDEDEAYVRELARAWGLPVKVRRINVRSYREKHKLSIEAAGRRLRHEALRELAIEIGAKKIALGHTLDDQAETILHRIIRGSGLRGLRGMSPIRLVARRHELFVVRPMLEAERREIREYLQEHKIAWREDSSNRDSRFLRNRLRLHLLPLIQKEFNPRFKFALVKLGQTSAAFYLLVREIAGEMYEQVKLLGKPGEVCFSAEEFARLPIPVQTLILDRAVRELLGVVPQMNFEQYMDVIGLCTEGGGGKAVALPRGLVAKREAYVLKIAQPEAEPKPVRFAPTRLRVPGKTRIPKLSLEIVAEVAEGKVVGLVDYIQNKDFTEEIMDFERVQGGLTLRQRKGGDLFRPLGSSGKMKLKKFLIDMKIPKNVRDNVPLVADGDRIVWVVGYRISDDVKVTETTRRVLKLRFNRFSK